MKKIRFAAAIVICLGVISLKAQNANNSGGPKDVALEWLTDFYHQDYDAAKKMSTDDTKNMIETIQSFTRTFPDSVKRNAQKSTITIKSAKIDGDKATVKFISSDNPTNDEELHLIKKDEKWLVQFSKNDLNSEPQEDKAKHKSVKH